MTKEYKDETEAYRSFLLRIWREGAVRKYVWRISIEEPLSGERKGFTGLGGLFEYLIHMLCEDPNQLDESAQGRSDAGKEA